jgi:hypothetical protein
VSHVLGLESLVSVIEDPLELASRYPVQLLFRQFDCHIDSRLDDRLGMADVTVEEPAATTTRSGRVVMPSTRVREASSSTDNTGTVKHLRSQ